MPDSHIINWIHPGETVVKIDYDDGDVVASKRQIAQGSSPVPDLESLIDLAHANGISVNIAARPDGDTSVVLYRYVDEMNRQVIMFEWAERRSSETIAEFVLQLLDESDVISGGINRGDFVGPKATKEDAVRGRKRKRRSKD